MINIKNKQECCGCEACAQICPKKCITMLADSEGFLYPKVDEEVCINCSLCEKICPIIDNNSKSYETQKIYAAKNKDKEVQFLSTSGGLFSLFSQWAIDNEGIVFGASYDDSFRVVHGSACTYKECEKFRGSKYVQSAIGEIFVEVKHNLKEKKIVLFSGTPCHIAALRLFLVKKYDNLYCIDFVCHGVPSPMLFKDYISFVTKKFGNISFINMRDKTLGWDISEMKLIMKSGKEYIQKPQSRVWRSLYSSGCITRPSCHSCPYSNFKRQGDITIADFWGIQRSNNDFYDKNGVNLVLVNTIKGSYLLDKVKNRAEIVESDITSCDQPQLNHPPIPSKHRNIFWRDYSKMNFKFIAKKYGNYSHFYYQKLFICRIINKIKNMK